MPPDPGRWRKSSLSGQPPNRLWLSPLPWALGSPAPRAPSLSTIPSDLGLSPAGNWAPTQTPPTACRPGAKVRTPPRPGRILQPIWSAPTPHTRLLPLPSHREGGALLARCPGCPLPCPAQPSCLNQGGLRPLHLAPPFWAPTFPEQGTLMRMSEGLLLQPPAEDHVHANPHPLGKRMHSAHR